MLQFTSDTQIFSILNLTEKVCSCVVTWQSINAVHRYGVVKTPGDMEMRPLESDDDDDEDVTMFNRKD